MVTRERNHSLDLESGRKTVGEEGLWDTVTGARQTTKLFGRVCSGHFSFDGSVKDEDGATSYASSNSCGNLSSFLEVSNENVELLADKMLREENAGLSEKNAVGEIHKKKSKKPPKPPRPPKSLVLGAADQKLVREISELAMLKRARIERMKALKKMKATKSSSSSGSLCAMAITILFLLVIILQGNWSFEFLTVSLYSCIFYYLSLEIWFPSIILITDEDLNCFWFFLFCG